MNDFECSSEGKYSLNKQYPYKIIINGNGKTLALQNWKKNFIHLDIGLTGYNNDDVHSYSRYYPSSNPNNTLEISISNLEIQGLQSSKFLYLQSIYNINVTLTSLSFINIFYYFETEKDVDHAFIDIRPIDGGTYDSSLLMDSCSMINMTSYSTNMFLQTYGVSSTIKNCKFANLTNVSPVDYGLQKFVSIKSSKNFNICHTNITNMAPNEKSDSVLFEIKGLPKASLWNNNSLVISDIIATDFMRTFVSIHNFYNVKMKNCIIKDTSDSYSFSYYLPFVISLTYDADGPDPHGSLVIMKNNTFDSIKRNIDAIIQINYFDTTNIIIENNLITKSTCSMHGYLSFSFSELTMFQLATGTEAKLLIQNNIFINNSGGAISILQSKDIMISNNVFENNTSITNGQISLGSGSNNVTVITCTFKNNSAQGDGAAIHVSSSTMNTFYVVNSIFIGNRARNGGAIYLGDGISYPMILSLKEYNGIVQEIFDDFDDESENNIIDVTNNLVIGWYILFDNSITLNEVNQNKDSVNVIGNDASARLLTLEGKKGMVNVPGVDKPALFVESTSIKIKVFNQKGDGTYVKVKAIPIISNSQDEGFCIFIGNQAAGSSQDSFKFNGGAIAAIQKINFFVISGAQFVENFAEQMGGAIYIGVSCRGLVFHEVNMTKNSVSKGEGGALTLSSFNAGFMIRDSIFIHNTGLSGGAIMLGSYNGIGTMQDPHNVGTIANCNFSNNAATTGGSIFFGIRNYIELISNIIEKSTTQSDGAGIYSENENTITIRKTSINFNVAHNGGGGGIYASKNSTINFGIDSTINFGVDVENKNDKSILSHNRANQGGALYLGDGSRISFFSSTTTISYNFATYFGGGIFGVRCYLPTVDLYHKAVVNFTYNEAAYGSAMSLMETIPYDAYSLKGSSFFYNVAHKGGTIFYIKSDTKYNEDNNDDDGVDGNNSPGNDDGVDGNNSPGNDDGVDGNNSPGNDDGVDGNNSPGNDDGVDGNNSPGNDDGVDGNNSPGNDDGVDGNNSPGNDDGVVGNDSFQFSVKSTLRYSVFTEYDDDFTDSYSVKEEYEPYPFNELTFVSNKAPYGKKVATQPFTIEAPSNLSVLVYNEPLPAYLITIRDFYGQVVEGDNVSTLSIGVESFECDERDIGIITGSTTYTLNKGRSLLNGVQTFCNPKGSIKSNIVFTTNLATDIIRAGSSLRLEDFSLNASTLMHFRKCVDGETSVNIDCIVCSPGTYSLAYTETARCKECNGVIGIKSCVGKNIDVMPGYWRRYSSNQAVRKCPMDSISCKGGNFTGNNSCNLGYTGPLCDVCATNYFKSEGQCNKCENGSMTLSGLVAFSIFILLVFFLIFKIYQYKRKTEKYDPKIKNIILDKMDKYIKDLEGGIKDTVATSPSVQREEMTDAKRDEIIEIRDQVEEKILKKKDEIIEIIEKKKDEIIGMIEKKKDKMIHKIKRSVSGMLGFDLGNNDNGNDKNDTTREAENVKSSQDMDISSKIKNLQFEIPGLSGISTQLKLIVSTIQIVSSVSFSLSVSMPIEFDYFTNLFSWINFSPSDIVPMGCYQIAYPIQLLGTTIAPMIFFILLYIVYRIEENHITKDFAKVKPNNNNDDDDDDDDDADQQHKTKDTKEEKEAHHQVRIVARSFLVFFFYVSFTILPGITTKIFNSYPCTNIDPLNEDNHVDDEFLRVDLSVSCSSELYTLGISWATLMIIVYPIGIPLFYFTLLFLVHDLILHNKVNVDYTKEELQNKIRKHNKILKLEDQDKYQLYLIFSQINVRLVKNLEDILDAIEIRLLLESSDPQSDRHELENIIHKILDLNNNPNLKKDDLEKRYEDLEQEHELWEANIEKSAWKVLLLNFIEFIVGKKWLDEFFKTGRMDMFESLSFLYAAYEGEYWYWEIIETGRRLVLTAVLSVCLPGSGAQSILSLMFGVLFIKLYSYYQPYQFEIDDVMAESGQWQIYLTFLGALIMKNNLLGKSMNSFVGILLVVVNTAMILEGLTFQVASDKTKNIWRLPVLDGDDTNDPDDTFTSRLSKLKDYFYPPDDDEDEKKNKNN